jgi:ligand-binding sensor domain-containing protein
MKTFLSPLLLLLFISSCGQDEPTRETIPAGPPVVTRRDHDPYFIKSKDTISTHGPRNITRNVLQDKNGNMWFATWEGIISYDGTRFTNHTLKAGLRHFHAFSVLEDKSGNIWFGTIGGGVYRYDGKSFINFTTTDSLISDFVTCMLEDTDGNMWFGTHNGLSRYDGKTFTNFTVEDGLGSNSINSIAEDKRGKLWLGTQDGVSCYNGKSFTDFLNKEGGAFYNVRSIIADKAGNIWIGSEGEGLCRYDGQSLRSMRMNFASYIFEDKTGNIWFSAGVRPGEATCLSRRGDETAPGNSGGMALYKYDPLADPKKGSMPFTKIVENDGLNDHQIFGITQDKTGNIWFGTMQGPCCYDPSAQFIQTSEGLHAASGSFTYFSE